MKKQFLFFITVLLLSFGCKKDDKFPDYIGELNAKINGTDWESYMTYGYEKKGDTIITVKSNYYKKINHHYFVFQGIEFKNIQLKKGMIQRIYIDDFLIPTNKTTSSFYTLQDFDVFCESFDILEADSLNNWIQITDEVNNYGEIWGNFSCTYTRISGCAASPYPDTLRFRNGTFHVKLK